MVHGLEERLLASPEKATLISDQLEGVVRAKHFWMDILCVDQLNTEARIAVTQHIPNIFMHASEALVLNTASGLRRCCVDVFEGIECLKEWFDVGDTPPASHTKLFQHLQCHFTEPFFEGILARLWPLQEVLLSN